MSIPAYNIEQYLDERHARTRRRRRTKFEEQLANYVNYERAKFQCRSSNTSGDIRATGGLIFRLRESKVSGIFKSEYLANGLMDYQNIWRDDRGKVVLHFSRV